MRTKCQFCARKSAERACSRECAEGIARAERLAILTPAEERQDVEVDRSLLSIINRCVVCGDPYECSFGRPVTCDKLSCREAALEMQAAGGYTPSMDEIRAKCTLFQKSWTKEEEQRHRTYGSVRLGKTVLRRIAPAISTV